MLPNRPAKKAKIVAPVEGEGSDEDPRGALRLADAKAAAKAKSEAKAETKAAKAAALSRLAPKGKAKSKSRVVGLAPAAPPPPKVAGKRTSKAKAPAPLPPPPAPPSPLSDDEFVVARPASSSSNIAAAFDDADPRVPRERRGYMPAIGGGSVFYKEYRAFGVGKSYKNWIFLCPHCPKIGIKACERTMGVIPKNTETHGHLEPLAFLHAWRDVPPGPQGHRKTHPTPEAVTAFFHTHKDELDELAEYFGGTP